MMTNSIQVENLRKQYGDFMAVNQLNFSIQPGEVVGFLGPNGAGKSTTLKMLTGFLAPTEGHATIQGIDVLADPISAQRQLGYLPENAPLYPDMTVHEYLTYIARIRGLGRSERHQAIERVSAQCAIKDRWHQPIGELSKGFRQRVGLAQALIHDPPIVILDEPTTGLDPNQIIEMRKLIRDIGRTKTVILSTHILSEVQVTCDRVIIIDQGTIVADGTVEEIIQQSQSHLNWKVVLSTATVDFPLKHIIEKLSQIDGVDSVNHLSNAIEGEYVFNIGCTQDIRRAVFDTIVRQGLLLLELSPSRDDLESVFHKLTEKSDA